MLWRNRYIFFPKITVQNHNQLNAGLGIIFCLQLIKTKGVKMNNCKIETLGKGENSQFNAPLIWSSIKYQQNF